MTPAPMNEADTRAVLIEPKLKAACGKKELEWKD